jgi:hypothetical protein
MRRTTSMAAVVVILLCAPVFDAQNGTQAPDLPIDEVTTTIRTLREELGALASSVANVDNVKPVPASEASEDFESGTLANWRIDQIGAGGWFSYSNGKTPPDLSRSDPNFPFEVPDPPQGKFAAVTDTNGPGRRILSGYASPRLTIKVRCAQV